MILWVLSRIWQRLLLHCSRCCRIFIHFIDSCHNLFLLNSGHIRTSVILTMMCHSIFRWHIQIAGFANAIFQFFRCSRAVQILWDIWLIHGSCCWLQCGSLYHKVVNLSVGCTQAGSRNKRSLWGDRQWEWSRQKAAWKYFRPWCAKFTAEGPLAHLIIISIYWEIRQCCAIQTSSMSGSAYSTELYIYSAVTGYPSKMRFLQISANTSPAFWKFFSSNSVMTVLPKALKWLPKASWGSI